MLTWRSANTAEGSRSRHALLLLHAFPLSAAMWQPQIDALGETGFTVVAPNAYGIEGSEEKEGWNFTDYAHELAALLDSLGIERVTVAGLSMGGYQAFEFYRLYPDKITSLVLCDTRAEGDAPEARAGREEFIRAVEQKGAHEAAERMIPNFFSPSTYTAKPHLVIDTRTMIEKQSVPVINAAMRAIMTRNDATPMLGAIRCPVLVVVGADDRVTPKATAAAINDRITGSRLLVLPDAGHLSNLEQPEEFTHTLLGHIENLMASL
ncbi:alpha/beta fold hydrolase [Chlorobium sp. KB01]|uniref:alpha/beta fold hydrolase n=1 Tax=Chlorobium sp. KB01 TaxID=1917528 RepID=UPI000978C342|nr:alpha/beta fold hydrolase [Chlorobium sp. KB01]